MGILPLSVLLFTRPNSQQFLFRTKPSNDSEWMWLGWRTLDKLSGQKHWSLSCHLLPLFPFSAVKAFRTLATQCDHPSLSLELSFYLLSHSLDSLRPTKTANKTACDVSWILGSSWEACVLDAGAGEKTRDPVTAGRKHVRRWVAVCCGARCCMSSISKDTVCFRHFKRNTWQ